MVIGGEAGTRPTGVAQPTAGALGPKRGSGAALPDAAEAMAGVRGQNGRDPVAAVELEPDGGLTPVFLDT